jgi:hypothetical protein
MSGRRQALALFAVALAISVAPAPASAGFFERLFGGFRHHRSLPDVSPLDAFARAVNPPPDARGESGPASAYCTRTCDGFHFRVQASASASAADMCHAFCPASETRLYSGSTIDTATAADGSRYADLAAAYVYRQHLVAGCTCNGRNVFGLAHVDAASDPTLRPGDVVATGKGLMAVTGIKDKVAEFSPAEGYGGFAKGYREKLSEIRVAPAPRTNTLASSIPAYALPQNRSAAR